jgi:hypothetical protein
VEFAPTRLGNRCSIQLSYGGVTVVSMVCISPVNPVARFRLGDAVEPLSKILPTTFVGQPTMKGHLAAIEAPAAISLRMRIGPWIGRGEMSLL